MPKLCTFDQAVAEAHARSFSIVLARLRRTKSAFERPNVVVQDFGHEERQLHCFSAPGNGGGAVLQCAFRKAGDAVDKQEEALLVATCSRSGVAPSDANVRVWSCETGELVQEWRAGARDAVAVAWSPCGAMVAAAAADSAVRVWHVKTGDAVLDAPMPEAVMAVAWGKSGSLAVGLCSGGVRVLEVAQS